MKRGIKGGPTKSKRKRRLWFRRRRARSEFIFLAYYYLLLLNMRYAVHLVGPPEVASAQLIQHLRATGVLPESDAEQSGKRSRDNLRADETTTTEQIPVLKQNEKPRED